MIIHLKGFDEQNVCKDLFFIGCFINVLCIVFLCIDGIFLTEIQVNLQKLGGGEQPFYIFVLEGEHEREGFPERCPCVGG